MPKITVETSIHAPIETVWQLWTEPEHIKNWCHASDDWHAPDAMNDLRKDGKFKTVMAAKDQSVSFDFEGVYTNIQEFRSIDYTMADGRTVNIIFEKEGDATKLTEMFDPEDENSLEMQKDGWQSILDNFKKYVEQEA